MKRQDKKMMDEFDWRPDARYRIMFELELNAQWSTCQRGRVASALVDRNGIVVVPARNGTPHEQPTCRDLGANMLERCVFCVHSENNVINIAAKLGIRTDGKDLYSLKRPCLGCANNIVQAGIAAVFYSEDYDTDGQRDYVLSMFENQGMTVIKLEPTEQQVEFSLMLRKWRGLWTNTL
jgi:dCMP deaminase